MAGASMKSIKLRIHSMQNTRQITKAMEMVAASKMNKAQEKALRTRQYPQRDRRCHPRFFLPLPAKAGGKAGLLRGHRRRPRPCGRLQ